MARVPTAWKKTAARLVEWRLTQRLIGLGIRLLVPRHRIGVSLVAFNEHRQVFLLRHVFHPYAPWGLPGGWLDNGESPETCLVRELREETGLSASIGPVLQILREPKPDHVGLAFLGRVEPGQVRLSAEILEAAWFDVDQLPTPLYPFTRLAIQRGFYVHGSMTEERWKV